MTDTLNKQKISLGCYESYKQFAIYMLPDVEVELLVLLLRIREAPCSNLVPKTAIRKTIIRGSSQFFHKYADRVVGCAS